MSSIAYNRPILCPNSSFESYNGSSGSNASYPDSGSDVTVAVSIFTSLLSLAIVIGNGLIIVSVAVVKKLRQPANYLIVSLALSDFLVGLIVLPLTIVYDAGGEWIFGSMICDVHVSFDVICCTASIMNLCMISIDRYLMITKPMTYPKRRTGKLMAFMIAVAWLVSCLIILPALFGFTENVKDSPDWILPVSSSSNETGFSLNATNDSIPREMDVTEFTDLPNFNKTLQRRSSHFLNLGQPYQVIKYRCNISQTQPTALLRTTLQAETCDEGRQSKTAQSLIISSSDLRKEIYVSSDIIGQYIQISLKSSQDFIQPVDCYVYGEKLRGKTCLISQEPWFTIYSTLGAFYIPLTVMLCMYWKIYAEASRFESKDRKQSSTSITHDYSESPSHMRSMEGYFSSSQSFIKSKISFNNNLSDSKNSAKFQNSDSDLCFSDSGDAGLLFNCCPNAEEQRNHHINGMAREEYSDLSLAEYVLRAETDLGSQTTCCGESLTSRGDEVLSFKTTSNPQENKPCFQCGNSTSEPSSRPRKMSGPASFATSNDLLQTKTTNTKHLRTRAVSASNITSKSNDFNESNHFSPAKPSRLGNGTVNGDLKFPPISENNVLELHPEHSDSEEVPEKSELLQKNFKKSDTSNSISSQKSGIPTSRSYVTGRRYSIFSASPVYGSRPQYCRNSTVSNRHFNNGTVFSQTKRRRSASARRTSTISKSSQSGSESISKGGNKKIKMLNQIRRRVSGASSRDRLRNVKATRTLGIIVGVFTFCWLPFFIVTFLRPFICEHPEAQDCIPLPLIRIVLWLGYLNSALNPLIYIGFSVDLRKSFCYLLSCKCTNVDRRLAQNEFRRVMSRERQDSFTSHNAAVESIM